MQHWLSVYANWYAKRNRRSGHLFQGRYKAFPVEVDDLIGLHTMSITGIGWGAMEAVTLQLRIEST